MEKKKRFKKRYVLLLMIVMLFGPKVYRYISYELTKENLVIEELEKIEYDDLAELEEYILEIDSTISVDKINNIVYTIKEDNLEDWYYDVVYNFQSKRYGIGLSSKWLIYDLAINDQYCYTKAVDDEYCYVSETETKDNTIMLDAYSSELYFDYGVVIIESSTNGEELYLSARADELFDVLNNAYIVAQGESTQGYNEAIEFLYSIHKRNGGGRTKSRFEEKLQNALPNHLNALEEINGSSAIEFVANYSKYSLTVSKLENYLDYV